MFSAEEEKLIKFANKLGLKIQFTESMLFVTTNKSTWTICISSGNITLFHSNFFNGSPRQQKYRDRYHSQKKHFHSIKNALYYIYRHDLNRYTQNDYIERRTESMFRKINGSP